MRAIHVVSCLLVVLLLGALVESSAKGCWEDWSRCTPGTMKLTGKAWLPCDSYCKICYKADGGKCVSAPSKNCPNVLKNNRRCDCINKRRSKDLKNPACWA
ncbi:hypothetical protein HELRODRAFT_192133 [Helobdella robusta]|uniref:Theromacin n=1 Tax=Helobdella robusta TaxID=6412 RepID=T1FTM1_HELRO|nr:hypothetical protein HELRODRAFT_192133 [Helobdella robusta]ESO03197.1 hypothetical protein HELRODRAFT_192133 [Helobdella robusta]